MENYEDNASVGDKIGEAFDGIAQKWSGLAGKTKGWLAGGTAVATLGGVAGGLALTGHEEELSPEQVQSGALAFDQGEKPLRDAGGKMALLNYFDESVPAQDRVLRISLATQLPEAFRDGEELGEYLDSVENRARSHTTRTEIYYVSVCSGTGETRSCHMEPRTRTVTDYHYYSYPLEIEKDMVPVNQEQERQVRDYFREFERLTGLKVEVSFNDPDAHIILANYRNQPDWFRGSLDYVDPDEIATYPEGAQVSGASLEQGVVVMNDRNWGSDNDMLSALGKPLGFENGTVNIVTLRAELERLGLPVKPLALGDDTYRLEDDIKVGSLMPDNILIDNGGSDSLVGSAKDDTLVSEAGQCGRIDTPRNQLVNIFGDGKRYCIAEGEFEIVRGGQGNDLIIAARGGNQTIEPGLGNDRIAYFQPDIGDTTILAGPDAEGGNTLFIHDAHIYGGDVEVQGQGNDITLQFLAPSGRATGSITLPNQLSGGGISRIVAVDDKGQPVFEKDVSAITTAEAWKNDVVEPMEKDVDAKRRGDMQKEAARWRNDVRRRRAEEIDLDAPFL